MTTDIFSLPIYISLPIVLTGYSAACLGTGLLIWTLLKRRSSDDKRVSAGTILATAFLLGEGVLASLWLLLALGGWLSFRVVAPLSIIFALGGLYIGRDIISSFRCQLVSIWRELRNDSWGWQALAFLTVLMCLAWGTSLGRPLGGDGSAFYFALGKFIAFSHRLVPMPGYESFSNIGLQGELHYAALMVLHSPEAAKLFVWPTIIAAGMILASLGRAAGMGRRGQWLTLSLLFSSSAVIWLSGDGKDDLFGAALGLAAYYWAVQIHFNRTKAALLLTGLFSGFSIVAKLSYAPVMVPSIALLVLWGYSDELKDKTQLLSAVKFFMSGALIILAGLMLAFIPHFIKNGLLYHNPLSPIGSGGIGWLKQIWFGPGITRQILFTYPLALTYGSYWAQYGGISPLVIAFAPLAIFLPRPRSLLSSPLAALTIAALVGVLAWMISNPSVLAPRYLLSTLLLLILLPARAAEYMSLNDRTPRLLTAGITICTLVVLVAVGLYFLSSVFYPNRTLLVLEGKMDECSRDGESCRAMATINQRAAPGERVYLAAYPRYWLRGDLLQCVSSYQDSISNDFSGDKSWLYLYQKGFTYLFIDETTHGDTLKQLDVQNPPAWLKLNVLYDDPGKLLVYQIKFFTPPSAIKPITCQRRPSSTIWEVISP
jgi:hypothetical protein